MEKPPFRDDVDENAMMPWRIFQVPRLIAGRSIFNEFMVERSSLLAVN
jgi:hypothetical protein